MNITEIVVTPSRSEDLSKYYPEFKTAKLTNSVFNNTMFAKVSSDSVDSYGLINNDKLVALLKISSERLNKPQILLTTTDPEFRMKGYLRYLINQALTYNNEIYSDDRQTPESKEFWQAMIQSPGPNNSISVYNQQTNSLEPVSKYSNEEIWNNKPEIVLVISKGAITESEAKYTEISNRVRSKVGRSDNDLFYTANGDSNP